jgi:hypothetical protein
MARVCATCKRPIPKNHATCPHCEAAEAAALEALEEPVLAAEDSGVPLGEEIAGGEQLAHAAAEQEAPVSGDSAVDLASLSGVVDLATLGDEDLDVGSGTSGKLPPDEGQSALDLAGTLEEDPAQLVSSHPSSLGSLDLAAAQDEALAVGSSPSGKGLQGDMSLEDQDQADALEVEEPPSIKAEEEAEEPAVIDLGSVQDVDVPQAPAGDSGTIHLAEVEEEESAEIGGVEPAAAESSSGVVDLATLGDEDLDVGSGTSGKLPPDEGQSALDLAGTLEEDPAQLVSSHPSGLGSLDLSAAQDEALAVGSSPSGKGLQGDMSLEDQDQADALDLGGGQEPAAPVGRGTDLNFVADALEPGTSSAYLEEQEGEAPAEAGEEAAEPEEFVGGPDIVEQVESGVDLGGARAGDETVREEVVVEDLAAEEESLGEGDSAVDLGAVARPEEEAAAPVSSAVDLGMTQEAEEEQPAASGQDLDDLESEAAALLETGRKEGEEEPIREEAADDEIDLGGGTVAEDEPAAEEEAPAEEEAAEEEEPAAKPPRRRGGALGLVAALFLGLLLGAGGLYGALFSGLVPSDYLPAQASVTKQPPRPGGPGQGGGTTTPGTPVGEAAGFDQAHGHLQGGDFSRALSTLEKQPEDNRTLAARGEARWWNRYQEMLRQESDLAKVAGQLKNDAAVRKAVQELTQANTAEAAFQLAQIEEMSEAPLTDVRAKYEEGMKRVPEGDKGLQALFRSALDRLDLQAQAKPVGGGADRR